MSASTHAGAVAEQPLGGRAADAAGAAGDERHAAGERAWAPACAAAWPPRAPSTRCRRPPARAGRRSSLDVARAAHHVDRVGVELGRDARGRLVAREGEHADAGREQHDRIGVAQRGRVGALAALVVGRVVRAVGREPLRRGPRAGPRSSWPRAGASGGSWCAGSGRDRRCRAPRARPRGGCPRTRARRGCRRSGRACGPSTRAARADRA